MTASVGLTRRGWSLVGAAIGLVAGSFLLGVVEMLDLAVAAAALVLGGLAWVGRRGAPELVLRRRVQPARLHVGSDGRIDLLAENRGRRTTPVLAATDSFDEGRRAARFLVPALAPGTTARAAYRIPTRRRGRYQVGPLWIVATDPFGLARRAWAALDVSELVVRPRVHDIAAPVAAGSRIATAPSDEPSARALVSDLGDDFLGLREYRVGDDLRRVHWRSTARTGELMIRQDEARWRSRAAVVLDVRPEGHDGASFEVAVEAVASIVARLVRLRRRVEVVTSAGEVLGTGGDPRHDVIDRLATVGPDPDDRLATVLAGIRAHRRADLVVAVLGAVDDATRGVLAALALDSVVVLTKPGQVRPGSRLTIVDASRGDFASAWNQTFAQWPHARASSHRLPSAH